VLTHVNSGQNGSANHDRRQTWRERRAAELAIGGSRTRPQPSDQHGQHDEETPLLLGSDVDESIPNARNESDSEDYGLLPDPVITQRDRALAKRRAAGPGYRFKFRQPFHLDAVKRVFFPSFSRYLANRSRNQDAASLTHDDGPSMADSQSVFVQANDSTVHGNISQQMVRPREVVISEHGRPIPSTSYEIDSEEPLAEDDASPFDQSASPLGDDTNLLTTTAPASVRARFMQYCFNVVGEADSAGAFQQLRMDLLEGDDSELKISLREATMRDSSLPPESYNILPRPFSGDLRVFGESETTWEELEKEFLAAAKRILEDLDKVRAAATNTSPTSSSPRTGVTSTLEESQNTGKSHEDPQQGMRPLETIPTMAVTGIEISGDSRPSDETTHQPQVSTESRTSRKGKAPAQPVIVRRGCPGDSWRCKPHKGNVRKYWESRKRFNDHFKDEHLEDCRLYDGSWQCPLSDRGCPSPSFARGSDLLAHIWDDHWAL